MRAGYTARKAAKTAAANGQPSETRAPGAGSAGAT